MRINNPLHENHKSHIMPIIFIHFETRLDKRVWITTYA